MTISKVFCSGRMEPYSGGFINYCLYLVDTERYKAEKYQRNPIMAKACAFVLHRLCEAQKHLLTVIGETDRFQTDLPFPELKEKVQDSGGGLQYRRRLADCRRGDTICGKRLWQCADPASLRMSGQPCLRAGNFAAAACPFSGCQYPDHRV